MTKLIIVEGLPCSGKSTAADHIAEKLGFTAVDEGTGDHPADYEFHAFLSPHDISSFNAEQQNLINAAAKPYLDGYIVPLSSFSGELFEKLLQYKIYDFLPWETEMPLMLGKWQKFADSAKNSRGYVFNCVLLQNPLCETMIRFGFDKNVSEDYIRQICCIIAPLEPVIVYLKTSSIADNINAALPERGKDWLEQVIDYHCGGEYGRANDLHGFDGYISALEERQRRELDILNRLNVPHIIIDVSGSDRSAVCPEIMQKLSGFIH